MNNPSTFDEYRKAYTEAIKDAERYRWLCDGNGYFMEENMLCHVSNEKQLADAAIDAAMEQSK